MNQGMFFENLPKIRRPRILLLFTFKIEVSTVLQIHVT